MENVFVDEYACVFVCIAHSHTFMPITMLTVAETKKKDTESRVRFKNENRAYNIIVCSRIRREFYIKWRWKCGKFVWLNK